MKPPQQQQQQLAKISEKTPSDKNEKKRKRSSSSSSETSRNIAKKPLEDQQLSSTTASTPSKEIPPRASGASEKASTNDGKGPRALEGDDTPAEPSTSVSKTSSQQSRTHSRHHSKESKASRKGKGSWHPPNRENPAVDQICITDVTSNLLTVTITECRTWHGFFRDRPQGQRSSRTDRDESAMVGTNSESVIGTEENND